MSNLPQQLPGHPVLLEDESLASFLIRLGEANFYPSPSILIKLILDGTGAETHLKARIDLLSHPAVFERIAHLAQVDCLQLYKATANRFAEFITPPETEIGVLDLPGNQKVPLLHENIAHEQIRPAFACQYCPLCIQQRPYYRLSWLLIATSVCLEHKCLLTNQCHNCKRPLRLQDIIKTRCSKCGIALGKAPCYYISDDEVGLLSQQVFQGLLFGKAVPLPSEDYLPTCPPRVLFRVVDGLRSTAQRLAIAGWKNLHTLPAYHDILAESFKPGLDPRSFTPYQSYCVYTTVFKGIAEWPSGFYELLDAQHEQKGNSLRKGGLNSNLGRTYSYWFAKQWQHAAFEFVQDAFDLYIIERYGVSHAIRHISRFRDTPALLNKFSYISTHYAAELLNVRAGVIQRFIRSGHLTVSQENPSFVKRSDVLRLRETWNSIVGRVEAAQLLGVSEAVVQDLVNIGLLSPEQSPDTGFRFWKFSEKDLCQLLDRVKSHTRIYEGSNGTHTFNLVGAVKKLKYLDLTTASVISGIAHGKLQAHRRPSSRFSCRDLVFDQADIDVSHDATLAEKGWLSRVQVLKRLKIRNETLVKWMEAGLLVPAHVFAKALYFDKAMIEGFESDHIGSKEAAELLGIKINTVDSWVHLGLLRAVSGPSIDGYRAYIFNRESLLHWRNERVLFGEAKNILGVSGQTLRCWVRQGKITPLNDLGDKIIWFSKVAVLQLHQERVLAQAMTYEDLEKLTRSERPSALSETVEMIRALAAERKSLREIARTVGVARGTVRKYLPGSLPVRVHPKLSSMLDPFKEQILRWMQEDHLYDCQVMLPRLQALGYQGGRKTLSDFVYPYRPQHKGALQIQHYEIETGELMQFDGGKFAYEHDGEGRLET